MLTRVWVSWCWWIPSVPEWKNTLILQVNEWVNYYSGSQQYLHFRRWLNSWNSVTCLQCHFCMQLPLWMQLWMSQCAWCFISLCIVFCPKGFKLQKILTASLSYVLLIVDERSVMVDLLYASKSCQDQSNCFKPISHVLVSTWIHVGCKYSVEINYTEPSSGCRESPQLGK